MKKEKIEIALMTLVILFFLFGFFLALWKLFGDSPTLGEMGFGLAGIMASWPIILTYKFGQINGRSIQFEKNVGNSFERVKEDFNELKTDFGEMKKEVKQDLNRIETKLDKII